MNALPPQPSMDAVLGGLVALTSVPSHLAPIRVPIPFVQDIHDALETALAWKAMPPPGIVASMVDSLAALDSLIASGDSGVLGTLSAELAALPAQLQLSALETIADGMVARLGEIAGAVAAHDLATTGPSVTALNDLADQYDTARSSLQATMDRLPALGLRVQAIPVELDAAQSRVASVLLETAPLPVAFPGAGFVGSPDQISAAVNEVLTPLFGWLHEAADKLDLSAIHGPITTVANDASAAVDGLDAGMAAVVTQTQHLFAQVEGLVDAVDVQGLITQITSAIDGFKADVLAQLTNLFKPVRAVVDDAVTEIGHGVDLFNPTDIVAALKGVLQKLTDTLNDPNILGVVNEINSAVAACTGQLGSVSFAPVTGEVVDEIGQVTAALKALDPATLSPALQLALQGAVLLLPHDLSFATGPIEADFDKLVDQGPGALVATVKAPVAHLMDQVKQFEPAALVGNALSGPFKQLISQMDGFQPSRLLDPVNHELATLKDRLKQEASPGRLLDPLTGPFDQLLAAFDQLHPDAMVKPLQDALSGAIDAILKAVPIDDVLKPVGEVLAKVQAVATVAATVVANIVKLHDLLHALADGPAQLDAWVASVASAAGAVGDTTALQASLVKVGASVDATKAAALSARFDTILASVTGPLDTFGPQTRLTAIVQAYRAVSQPALGALADSSRKTAVIAALNRVNPLVPAFAAPLAALASFRLAVGSGRDALTAQLGGWDAKYHSPDGAFACVAGLQPTAANLSIWVGTTLGAVLQPVRAILALAAPMAAFLDPIASNLQGLMADVKEKFAGILTGPGSVGAVKDAIDHLVAHLRGLNLGFLTQSLGDLFHHVRDKLTAISPAALKAIVDKAFDDILATLDLSQILSPDDAKKLDDDYSAVVTKLKALDPGKLVIDLVQPLFDSTVTPLIQAFDLSAVLEAVSQMLVRLKADLKTELGKVNDAYTAMLAAVPAINPLSLALSVNVDIGSLF